MFKKILIVVCLIFLAPSCNGKLGGPKKPKDLISKNKMVNILIDAKIISSTTGSNRKMMEAHGVDINNYVFNKYNIDSLQFANSNAYYAFHIKDYEEIYVKVIDSLNKLKSKFTALRAEEKKEALQKKKADSLKLVLAKKDSLDFLIKIKDSLKVLSATDSLTEILEKKKFEEGGVLIKPVSETDFQSQ